VGAALKNKKKKEKKLIVALNVNKFGSQANNVYKKGHQKT